MPWFQTLCRQAGLAVHKITTPQADRGPQDSARATTTQVRRSVEEFSPEPGVTLRRTTIEEVELRPGGPEAGSMSQE